MNLKLKRNEQSQFGIFGNLYDEDDKFLFVTLEHAYSNSDGKFYAKIPLGQYVCIRGKHRLDGMISDFETFEITGVPDRSGLLFHWGNYNKDSSGCVLLGLERDAMGPEKMIMNSKMAFHQFMAITKGLGRFKLTISS